MPFPSATPDDCPLQVGAHFSTQGGLEQALLRGAAIGADCVQLFTRNQRQWHPKGLEEREVEAFRRVRGETGIRTVMSHGSYLVNLAAPDPDKHAKSVAAMEAELERCHRLGVELLNFHPGAHMRAGLEAGIERIADTLNAVCRRHPDKRDVRLVLENVAGQGTTVGRTFGELAAILERLVEPERFAVCVDTAHAFAAGYDLRSAEGWETTWAELDREVGLERLAAIHVNDSAVPFDSRKDRHANLGHGEMGTEPFRRLVTDRRTSRVPLFLETPGGTPAWEEETAWLRVEAADPQGTGPHSNLRDRGGVPGR